MTRKDFIAKSLAASAVAATVPLLGATDSPVPEVSPETGRGPGRGPRQSLKLVLEFVQAGHRDLDKVKAMLAEAPGLIHARWDWGDGDWESALEGAAHMGRTDIVRYLLANGARVDSFSAAMLGDADTIQSLVKLEPGIANAKGPHGLPLMFYVGYGGSVPMAEAVVPLLTEKAAECNRALHTATLSNREALVAWLLKNGVTDVNTQNFFGKTPLDAAVERKFDGIAKLLRAHGGKPSN
jgi:ankyrin repeat protein